jgi:hypothetical protein
MSSARRLRFLGRHLSGTRRAGATPTIGSALALGLAAALTLAGCSATPSSRGSASSASPSATASASPGGRSGSDTPASCAALTFTSGARVDPTALATCVDDFRAAVGTGRADLALAGTTASIEWKLTKVGLYAYTTGFTGGHAVLAPDDGWVDDRQGGWTHADANGTSAEKVAAAAIPALRQSLSPEFTKSTVARAPGYTVGERVEVEVANGDTRSLWPVRADGAFEVAPGYAVDALTLYFSAPGELMRQELTGSGFGRSAASTTVFSRYGAKVDLGEAEKLTGVDLG